MENWAQYLKVVRDETTLPGGKKNLFKYGKIFSYVLWDKVSRECSNNIKKKSSSGTTLAWSVFMVDLGSIQGTLGVKPAHTLNWTQGHCWGHHAHTYIHSHLGRWKKTREPPFTYVTCIHSLTTLLGPPVHLLQDSAYNPTDTGLVKGKMTFSSPRSWLTGEKPDVACVVARLPQTSLCSVFLDAFLHHCCKERLISYCRFGVSLTESGYFAGTSHQQGTKLSVTGPFHFISIYLFFLQHF